MFDNYLDIAVLHQTTQQIQNNLVLRHFTLELTNGARTANSALRGEVGATSSEARDMKIKILFTKRLLEEDRNQLIREVFQAEYEEGKNPWIKTLKKYMNILNFKITDIQRNKKENIIKKVKEWDTRKWLREMENKSTLTTYRQFKRSIKEEQWIDNTENSKLLVRGRTNTLDLNWRNGYQGKSTKCPV